MISPITPQPKFAALDNKGIEVDRLFLCLTAERVFNWLAALTSVNQISGEFIEVERYTDSGDNQSPSTTNFTDDQKSETPWLKSARAISDLRCQSDNSRMFLHRDTESSLGEENNLHWLYALVENQSKTSPYICSDLWLVVTGC